MDSVERLRQLPGRLAAVRLIALLAGLAVLVAGCVAGDVETASIDDEASADRTLPSATTTSTVDDTDDPDPDATAAADDSTTTTATTVPPDPLQGLDAELVADGFDQPILVTGVPGTDALLVVEREGVVRVVTDGATRDEPFLDLTDRLLSNSIEQGLLGLAFHPDHADNGTFFAYWTDPEGDSRLSRFDTSDPLTADPDSEELVLAVDQPAERHNAGHLVFGPDGLLYVSLGDGGSGGAPAQDTTNLLGSILRIDVDQTGPGGRLYAIPPGNPFDDEMWVYGLRNPWRFSIDPTTDRVYIGDVGQDRAEEINVVDLTGGGANFGWSEMEGDGCFRSGCDVDAYVHPVFQYTHDEGCSVTGGRVYRGAAIPELDGHYFFADWCGELLRSFRLTDREQVVEQLDWTGELGELGQVTSFGVDGDGELLAVNWAGELYRIVPLR